MTRNLQPFMPGTDKPEAYYERVTELSRKLGIPAFHAFLDLESIDHAGELVGRHHGRSRTWNRNFYNAFFAGHAGVNGSATFGAGYLSLKKTNGTVTQYVLDGNNGFYTFQSLWSPFADVTSPNGQQSIRIGSGVTAESFEGYALAAEIASGSSSGQLMYQAPTSPDPTFNGTTKTWTGQIKRVFNNISAGNVNVNETGFFVRSYPDTVSIMLSRDVLPSTVVVAPGGQLTVTYTYTITFPA